MTINEIKKLLIKIKEFHETALKDKNRLNDKDYYFLKGEHDLANQLLRKIDEQKDDLIYIGLPLEIWQEIASACISVADYDITTDKIKDDLRKTYYQIKAETR